MAANRAILEAAAKLMIQRLGQRADSAQQGLPSEEEFKSISMALPKMEAIQSFIQAKKRMESMAAAQEQLRQRFLESQRLPHQLVGPFGPEEFGQRLPGPPL